MEALARHVGVRAGVPKDRIAFPALEIGHEQLLLQVLLHNVGVDPEERLGMRAEVRFEEVICFLLRVHADPDGVLLHLVDVVEKPRPVVVDLEQPVEPGVAAGVLGAQQFLAAGLEGVHQQQRIARAHADPGLALVRRIDGILGLGFGDDPALADLPARPRGIFILAEPEPLSRRQEVPGYPTGFHLEQPVAGGQLAADAVFRVVLAHLTLPVEPSGPDPDRPTSPTGLRRS